MITGTKELPSCAILSLQMDINQLPMFVQYPATIIPSHRAEIKTKMASVRDHSQPMVPSEQ